MRSNSLNLKDAEIVAEAKIMFLYSAIQIKNFYVLMVLKSKPLF